MAEPEVIMEFKRCGVCGCEVTLTQKAFRHFFPDEKEIPETGIPSKMIPITKQSGAVNISLPVVPGIAIFEDYCGECGAPRATKVVRQAIPMAMIQAALAAQIGQKPKR